MKFALLLITLSAVLSGVYAFDSATVTTNARRLALGMSPFPPVRRATEVTAAKRSRTSPKPGNHMENSCNTGTVCCCNSLFEAKHSFAHHLSGVLGVDVPANALVGDGCSPMSIGAISGNQCSQQPVCCQDNQMHGLVVVGCSPININL